MKLKEIVQAAMDQDEEIFRGLNAGRTTKIVTSVLQVLAKEIDSLNEGKVAVSGFGNFVIKQVTSEKDGVKAIKKRVLFRSRAKK